MGEVHGGDCILHRTGVTIDLFPIRHSTSTLPPEPCPHSLRWLGYSGLSRRHLIYMLTADQSDMKYAWTITGGGRPILGELSLYPLCVCVCIVNSLPFSPWNSCLVLFPFVSEIPRRERSLSCEFFTVFDVKGASLGGGAGRGGGDKYKRKNNARQRKRQCHGGSTGGSSHLLPR